MPVGECDHGRSVPRLHDPAVILVEVFHGLRHVLMPVPRGRHQHRGGVLYAPAAHVDGFECVVQGCGVRRGIILADRQDVFHVVAEQLGVQRAFARRHPVAIAADGVYLAVVRQHPVRMRQLPRAQRVGAETRMHHREMRLEVRIGQVRIEAIDLLGFEHSLVDDGARRQR